MHDLYEDRSSARFVAFGRTLRRSHSSLIVPLVRLKAAGTTIEGPGELLTAAAEQGRNRVQLQLLEHEELNEATAALSLLRARADVDARRLGVVGHSFEGSLSLLMAARDPEIRAAVIFAGAGPRGRDAAAGQASCSQDLSAVRV